MSFYKLPSVVYTSRFRRDGEVSRLGDVEAFSADLMGVNYKNKFFFLSGAPAIFEGWFKKHYKKGEMKKKRKKRKRKPGGLERGGKRKSFSNFRRKKIF